MLKELFIVQFVRGVPTAFSWICVIPQQEKKKRPRCNEKRIKMLFIFNSRPGMSYLREFIAN